MFKYCDIVLKKHVVAKWWVVQNKWKVTHKQHGGTGRQSSGQNDRQATSAKCKETQKDHIIQKPQANQ